MSDSRSCEACGADLGYTADGMRAKLTAALKEGAEAREALAKEQEICEHLVINTQARADELDCLRAALEPTDANVEAVAQDLFRQNWSGYEDEDGPPEKPLPPWQDVIDEGSADGWREVARAVLAAIAARAAVAAKEPGT